LGDQRKGRLRWQNDAGELLGLGLHGWGVEKKQNGGWSNTEANEKKAPKVLPLKLLGRASARLRQHEGKRNSVPNKRGSEEKIL